MYNESRKESTRKYISEKCDRIQLFPKKGTKDRLKQHAREEGKTLTQYILDCCDEHKTDR